MSTYNYRCLPPGCIRLLRLSPHEDDNAPIRCQLFEHSLASARRKGTHLYEALSYCWGSPTKSQTVFTDSGLLYVTENLYAALLRLRDPALERIIWIDAICINQDDLDEKGKQVQRMAEIFARASCVIVWLENVTGNRLIDSESQAGGRQALRVLEAAAGRSKGASPPDNEQDLLAVEKILRRPWFRRIWVLQEVAAARHVLIMSKDAEIDGQAFCSGLNQMSRSLLLTDENARARIRSTVDLIECATFRPKDVAKASYQFSLHISSLVYLIELHHVREATDRRDKIYALLGMSNDTPTGLVPNYQISWKDLFSYLVKSVLPGSSSVTTTDEHETALIRIRGCVLATVKYAVPKEDSWHDHQLVNVSRLHSNPHLDHSLPMEHLFWISQATTRVCSGDIVCLLQGTSIPTIVRAYQDYCSIVAIAVNTDVDMTPITGSWRSQTQFEFLLAWSWKAEIHPSNLDDFLVAQGLSPISCANLQVPDGLNTAVMLLETEQYYSAMLKVHSIIVACEDVGESAHPDAVAAAKLLDVVCRDFVRGQRPEAFEMMRNMIGRKRGYIDVTEDFLIQFTSASGWEPMAFVLDTQGKAVTISESILTAAAKNENHGKDIMEALLDDREDQITITEVCLKAAIQNMTDGVDIIELLLNSKAVQISIPESLLIELARGGDFDHWKWNEQCYEILRLIIDNRGDQITKSITENVLAAAEANEVDSKKIIELLRTSKDRELCYGH